MAFYNPLSNSFLCAFLAPIILPIAIWCVFADWRREANEKERQRSHEPPIPSSDNSSFLGRTGCKKR